MDGLFIRCCLIRYGELKNVTILRRNKPSPPVPGEGYPEERGIVMKKSELLKALIAAEAVIRGMDGYLTSIPINHQFLSDRHQRPK